MDKKMILIDFGPFVTNNLRGQPLFLDTGIEISNNYCSTSVQTP